MEIRLRFIATAILAILVSFSPTVFSQGKKVHQELSAGGLFTTFNEARISDRLTAQNLPGMSERLAGTQISYRVSFSKIQLGLGYGFGLGKQANPVYRTTSTIFDYGAYVGYGLFHTPSAKVFIGPSAKLNVVNLRVRAKEGTQDLNNLLADDVTVLNSQVMVGGKLMTYLFDDSSFPLAVGLGYDLGLGGSWKVEDSRIINPLAERLSKLSISVDIPLGRW